MNPIQIHSYLTLAGKALELAVKAKQKFLPRKGKAGDTPPATLETLQADLAAQSELLVDLSQALAATAKTLRRVQIAASIALLLSLIITGVLLFH